MAPKKAEMTMEMRTAGEGYVLVHGKDRVKSSKDARKLPEGRFFSASFAQVPRKLRASKALFGKAMGFPKALS